MFEETLYFHRHSISFRTERSRFNLNRKYSAIEHKACLFIRNGKVVHLIFCGCAFIKAFG